MKNIIARLISIKQEIEDFESMLMGAEICYKGDYGSIMLVNFQAQTLVLYLENAEGKPREETISFKEYLDLD